MFEVDQDPDASLTRLDGNSELCRD